MRFLIGAIALICASSVMAADQATTVPLTLSEALASVLENNPQLQASDFDNQAAAARIRQQAQVPPWQLGVDLENIGGTGQVSGTEQLETTLSIGRVLELGDKGRLRGDVARNQARLLRNEQDAERLDLLAETAKRFLLIAHTQAKQALAEERVAVKQRTLKVAERRFNLGKAAKAERSRARIDFARAELELEETQHRLSVARKNLAVLWGELTPAFQTVNADLFRLEPVPDQATLEQLLEQHPSLVQFATRQRLAEARMRLAEASQSPDVEFRAGVRHFNEQDDVSMLFSMRIPLGSGGRAKPRLDEATALSAREPLLAQNKRLALRATIFDLVQELNHDRDVIEALQQRIIPAAKEAQADYSRGYAAGRYSLLELTQAQDTLLQAHLEALEAAVEYQLNRTDIDRLTAGAISQQMNTGVSP